MATLIGRVGMVIKGAWDSSVAYDTLDVVTYNNNTYIAKQASPAGTLPTNTTYWQLSLDASQLQPKEAGKGLSTNDYDNTAKGIVDSTPTNLAAKADKVSGATNGNLAGLDANGNLMDSGVAAGNTSISSIGDGTLTGAVYQISSKLTNYNNTLQDSYTKASILDIFEHMQNAESKQFTFYGAGGSGTLATGTIARTNSDFGTGFFSYCYPGGDETSFYSFGIISGTVYITRII